MLCRRVQVERPSCSTSGGQSGRGLVGGLGSGVVVGMDAELELELEMDGPVVCDLVRAAHEAKEVQVRQLRCGNWSMKRRYDGVG